jgi:hypothetical protein
MAEASRRQVLQTTALGTLMFTKLARAAAAPDIRFDFARPLEGWKTVSGSWAIAEVPGAIQKGSALVQSATTNAFNVIVAPGGPYTNVEVSVRFKPICGREDASGGIVFASLMAAITSFASTHWRTILIFTTTIGAGIRSPAYA